MDKQTLVKVINKYSGVVGYSIPDLMLHRNFYPNETKEITYDELEKLSYQPGGEVILKEYLEIADPEVANMILNKNPEPEYYYSEEDVKRLMTTGSLDEFLDCLDFAPNVILDMVKTLAVDLPLNDVAKRQAIKQKLNFDVTKAIEIKNTKFDGGDEDTTAAAQPTARRVATTKAAPTATGRRYTPTAKE